MFETDENEDFCMRVTKPAVMRAFQAAKDANPGKGGSLADDFVTLSEFRLLLVYVKRYFELLAMFDEVDTGNDRRVDFGEFQAALRKLEEWGVKARTPHSYLFSCPSLARPPLLLSPLCCEA